MKLYLNEDTIPFEDKFSNREWAFDDEEYTYDSVLEYERVLDMLISNYGGSAVVGKWLIEHLPREPFLKRILYYDHKLVGCIAGAHIIQMDYSIKDVNDFFEYIIYVYAKNNWFNIEIVDGTHPRTDMYFGIINHGQHYIMSENKSQIEDALNEYNPNNDEEWVQQCISSGIKYLDKFICAVLPNGSIYVNCPKYGLPAEVFSRDNVIVSGE